MRPKAQRSTELNHAISKLWQAAGIHSKNAFYQQIVPIYTALLDALREHQAEHLAEQRLIDLLNTTTEACHRRWTQRLPVNRPGSDYRKYEIVYTEALITAMAVDELRRSHSTTDPETLAEQLLPEAGRARLQSDPTVWADWLGYFQQSEIGGLYALATGNHNKEPTRRQDRHTPNEETKAPANKTTKRGGDDPIFQALKTALNNGTLSYNQPGDTVQVDREGRTFLEYPAILHWCIEHLQWEDDLKAAQKRLDKTRCYKRSPNGHQLFRGRLRPRDNRCRGYVFEDATLLWEGDPPTGKFVIDQLTRR